MKINKLDILVLLLMFVCALTAQNNGIILKGEPMNADFEYKSEFYRIGICKVYPFIQYLSVDALGKGKLDHNTILFAKNNGKHYELKRLSDAKIELYDIESNKLEWIFTFNEKKISIESFSTSFKSPETFRLNFGKRLNHVTLLGMMIEENVSLLPALLHFPDMGTFAIRCSKPNSKIGYFADRRAENPYISVSLPTIMDSEKSIKYSFEVVNVFPKFDGIEQPKYDAYRRNYLNLYQVNPKIMGYANNSGSDACSFTLYLSSILALNTPNLVDSLSALDILRMSLERYMNGLLSYGMDGYQGSKHYPFNSLDAFPSMVIASCNYVKGSNDLKWAEKNYIKIKDWLDKQMKRDRDGDGLVEYEFSGNTGSWPLDAKNFVRPANWWDTIGFGHIDGYSNILTFNALNQFSELCLKLRKNDVADIYAEKAALLKKNYFNTLYNPKTGVIAGWKSADGELHDYYFLFVNSMAIYYDLVPEKRQKPILQKLFQKMEQMGLKDFKLGLPGNIIPVKKLDYVSINNNKRFGASDKEDGSDGFQIYENGGLSLNWSYYTVKALEKAGMHKEYNCVVDDLLVGMDKGEFQGYITKDMTKDWRKWNGDSWGYEGYLCDGYLVLLAINEAKSKVLSENK